MSAGREGRAADAAPSAERAAPRWIPLALALSVVAAYHAVGSFDFVRYDDPEYVRDNPLVRRGLTWDGVRWAFASAHSSNWHPLTWLSHMLDVELFGMAPGAHHWSSVALHALGSVLCYLALRALTGRAWPSAAVAALFALHPLRVESVAWISERKDVLSGVLFFALLLAYARHARAPSPARYALVVAALVAGLLAKPMLVSAPLVLLLLDAWPLGRLRGPARRLAWLEKLPLLALAAASSAVTVWSQREGGALGTLEALPLAERLANAPVAVARYVAHFVWPSGLAYFYPHPGFVAERASPWDAAALGALAALGAACAAAWLARRRAPELAVGWAWFLVMLAPVIGIVQVGEQALADRYAYLPAVGLQVALAFGLARLAGARPALRAPLAAAAAAALLACGALTARQSRTWRDSEALFRRALAVTDDNYAAWHGLGNELAATERPAEAREAYERALAIHPRYGPALYGLGLLAQKAGDAERALELYRAATDALPGLAAAHLNRGGLLASRGDVVEAAQEFERVLELFPGHPDARFNLAQLLLVNGRPAEAAQELEAVVRAVPAHTPAWEKLGEARLRTGERALAVAALARAVRDPGRVDAARLLAGLLASAPEPELRDAPRALELARRAAAASGRRDPRVLDVLALALATTGDFARAAEVSEECAGLLTGEAAEGARQRAEAYRRGEIP